MALRGHFFCLLARPPVPPDDIIFATLPLDGWDRIVHSCRMTHAAVANLRRVTTGVAAVQASVVTLLVHMGTAILPGARFLSAYEDFP